MLPSLCTGHLNMSLGLLTEVGTCHWRIVVSFEPLIILIEEVSDRGLCLLWVNLSMVPACRLGISQNGLTSWPAPFFSLLALRGRDLFLVPWNPVVSRWGSMVLYFEGAIFISDSFMCSVSLSRTKWRGENWVTELLLGLELELWLDSLTLCLLGQVIKIYASASSVEKCFTHSGTIKWDNECIWTNLCHDYLCASSSHRHHSTWLENT